MRKRAGATGWPSTGAAEVRVIAGGVGGVWSCRK